MAYLASITNSTWLHRKDEMYIIKVEKEGKYYHKLPTKVSAMLPDLYFDDQDLICVCISDKSRYMREY